MSKTTDFVNIPSRNTINSGLTPTTNQFMMDLFGNPGKLTDDCSEVLNIDLKRQMTTDYVHPKKFRVTGLRPAVESLKRIFTRMEKEAPGAFENIGTAGMLCVRRVRGGAVYSNHSWGTAIDLSFGGQLTPLGATKIHRGLLMVYRFFYDEGWFWGAGFTRPDAMHFEVSKEKLTEWYGKKE